MYYQGARGALVVCALDRPGTVASVPEWVRGFREVVGPQPVAVLVDAGDKEAVEGADIAAVRAQVGGEVPVLVTSVETPERTQEALQGIAKVVVEGYSRREGLPAEGELRVVEPKSRPRKRRFWGRRSRRIE